MSVQTYTYTWTQTRVETIQDQFRYLLIYANVSNKHIDKVVSAVGEKVIEAVGVYGCDNSKKRVIEVELRIDWALNAKLTLTVPSITGGLPGWDGKQAPEIRVAGRRFADTANELKLSKSYWIRFTPAVLGKPALHNEWKRKLNLGGTVPDWKNAPVPGWKKPPIERSETFLDLGEATVYIRRAGD